MRETSCRGLLRKKDAILGFEKDNGGMLIALLEGNLSVEMDQ